MSPCKPCLTNTFLTPPEPTLRINTSHRKIATPLPVPASSARLAAAARLFPQVNCYQPPIIWERASGYQVFDSVGNVWIDFTSTAVTTNTGHGHDSIRQALAEHIDTGLLAQFNFASEIRIELAEKLVELAPDHCDQVYFWTVGSETIEAALRVARLWGMHQHPEKWHVLTHVGDFHGWTLGAHQLSGSGSQKNWLASPDRGIHHLPFPRESPTEGVDWKSWLDRNLGELADRGVRGEDVAAVVIETLQGWGALPLPVAYIKRLREWADAHQVLLVFDEIQTGFGRTGKMFGHEHYGVKADLICVGKGVTSSLPLAAVLGPKEVFEVLAPAEITTTHAGHPLSCAAALANLAVLEKENLVAAADRKGALVRQELHRLQQRFPRHVSEVCGLGLLNAIHVCDPQTGEPSRELARDWTWSGVRHGVMLFQVNQPTIKVCPPLTTPDDALVEGVQALGQALTAILD